MMAKRKHGQEQEDRVLLELLNCPVCLERMLPPLMQCEQGHLLCNACRARPSCSVCPTCRAGPVKARNLALEALAEGRLCLPCTHAGSGCPVQLGFGELEAHAKDCEFRPVTCQWRGCDTELPLIDAFLQDHMMSAHRASRVAGSPGEDGGVLVPFKEPPSSLWLGIWHDHTCSAHGATFSVRMVATAERYFCLVLFLGPRSAAGGFECRLALEGAAEIEELWWTGRPSPIATPHMQLVESGSCFSVPKTAVTLAQKRSGGRLALRLEIQSVTSDEDCASA